MVNVSQERLTLKFEIPSGISEGDVLESLNGSGQRLTAGSEWNWGRQWEGASDQEISDNLIALRADALSKLRACIDEWIDSGQTEHGETPDRRDQARSPRAYAEALEFWKESQNSATSSGLRLEPVFNSSDPEAIDWKARRIIFLILFGELRFRIARCRYRKCGRYFLLSESRRKQVYENGLFCCIQHNRAESATREVETRRKDATKRLIEWAALEVLSSKTNINDREVKEALVKSLNKRLRKDPNRTRDRIKVNWVTRHWEKIIEEVKSKKGGTSNEKPKTKRADHRD